LEKAVEEAMKMLRLKHKLRLEILDDDLFYGED